MAIPLILQFVTGFATAMTFNVGISLDPPLTAILTSKHHTSVAILFSQTLIQILPLQHRLLIILSDAPLLEPVLHFFKLAWTG